ncbi:hypothetical protein H257_08670 [Aphanomyces astaci]|uniref:Uncharacterized protein n=1 Tax=Aphanomyces astaci TaxID=112090 RepID=W4GEZ4_APHAT|nr:hypothetical protein H257_08670 [Aphanomyces astaci]ETV77846.1 hypothetical protein H257_08670 [Aphanomyces astaci]|eukprot:XP_009832956.1 hypothetical protein H257_08670 [Aphanomyces astaci]
MKRFKLFEEGGAPEPYVHATWLVHQEAICAEELCLPAKGKKRVGRSTIDVGGRILTLALLSEIDATVDERKAATKLKQAKRAKKRKKRHQGKQLDYDDHDDGVDMDERGSEDGQRLGGATEDVELRGAMEDKQRGSSADAG